MSEADLLLSWYRSVPNGFLLELDRHVDGAGTCSCGRPWDRSVLRFLLNCPLLHATIATVGIKGQMELRAYVLRDARKEELGVFVVQVGARSMSRG